MRGPEFLRQHVGKLRSSMGGVVPGSHAAMRGLDLHTNFRDANWADLYLFAITGRRFSPAQLELLQSIWVYTSYPDARLWNNRVAALAGNARSTGTLALAAALAVSEATIYGGGTHMPAIDFLQRTLGRINQGANLGDCIEDELQKRRAIAGFGRPITSTDERLTPLRGRARSLGLDGGPHLALAHRVDEYLQEKRMRMRMNFGALAAALVADQGLSPAEFYLYGFMPFLAGMVPVFIEANSAPEGAFLPIPCEHINYCGPQHRPWIGRIPSRQSVNASRPTSGGSASGASL